MILILLLIIPLVSGLLCFTSDKAARYYSLIGTILTLALVVVLSSYADNAGEGLVYQYEWSESLGASFKLSVSGFNYVLLLLTAIVFPLVFMAQFHLQFEHEDLFYGLMMLTMTGLLGVFLAEDLLLFYFFWELVLIPMYFLASHWGYEKRAKVAIKFFIYTFFGSFIMLAAIIYLYLNNPELSFEYHSMIATASSLPPATQVVLFGLFFTAFAIKAPIFPFHTWQPDTYDETYTPVTIILSAIMVKMGLFGIMKWLMPLFPDGTQMAQTTVMTLSLISIIYASILALKQTNIKRLFAYSSIAHVGLMSLGLFANAQLATEGALLQMFNHGITITGLWLVVWILEQCYKTREMKEMGGLSILAPALAIMLLIISFSNLGLPLTNNFPGEYMLFMGITQGSHPYSVWFMALATTTVVFSAIYMLNMLQKVIYGKNTFAFKKFDISPNELFVLIIIVGLIVALGVYPDALLRFIQINIY